MPIALILEILQVASAAAAALPQVVALVQSASKIIQSGSVTAEEEAKIRSDLDSIRSQIDSTASAS